MITVFGKNSLKWKCRERVLDLGCRPLVMGVLNVTPDSFSDGGIAFDRIRAVERGLKMADDGADIIDVGGESTRPGADEVSVEEELERVVSVIKDLCERIDLPVSIDTTKAEVARGALEAGAVIVNDVSALTLDVGMVDVAREYHAGLVLMHMRGNPRSMQDEPRYDNVVEHVVEYMKSRVKELVLAGIDADTIAIDPGIGFGKTFEHNLELLAGLDELEELGRPVVVGLSRKSLIGAITGRAVDERLAGSIAGFMFCAVNGVHVIRVHDVKESRDAALLAEALCERKTCGEREC